MRNKNKLQKLWMAYLALPLVILVLLAACAPAAVTPKGERQIIKIGCPVPLTGPYSVGAIANQMSGYEDFWKWHEDKGGLTVGGKGYKIELLWGDSKAEIPTTTSLYKRFVSEGMVIAWIVSSHEGVAMYTVAEQLKVPNVGTGSSKAFQEVPGWTFGVGTGYPEADAAAIKWYKEKVWKGTGKMKVGRLYWDIEMGKSVNIPEVNDTLSQDIGVELLPVEWFPMAVSDFTPNLIRIRDQKPDLVFFQALGPQYAQCLKDANRLGMKSTEPQFMCTLWGFMEKSFLDLLPPEVSEGSMGLWLFNRFPQEDNDRFPAIKEMCDAMQKYRGSRVAYDQNYTKGWAVGKIQLKAITLALEKYGYPLSGEQLYNSMQAIDKWDWGLAAPMSYANGDRLGWHDTRVCQVKNGKMETISDWLPAPDGIKTRAPWIWGKK